jgi:hypothetical protein
VSYAGWPSFPPAGGAGACSTLASAERAGTTKAMTGSPDPARSVCHARMHRATQRGLLHLPDRAIVNRVGTASAIRAAALGGDAIAAASSSRTCKAVVGAGCYPPLLPAISDRQLPVDGAMRMPRFRSRARSRRHDRIRVSRRPIPRRSLRRLRARPLAYRQASRRICAFEVGRIHPDARGRGGVEEAWHGRAPGAQLLIAGAGTGRSESTVR